MRTTEAICIIGQVAYIPPQEMHNRFLAKAAIQNKWSTQYKGQYRASRGNQDSNFILLFMYFIVVDKWNQHVAKS